MVACGGGSKEKRTPSRRVTVHVLAGRVARCSAITAIRSPSSPRVIVCELMSSAGAALPLASSTRRRRGRSLARRDALRLEQRDMLEFVAFELFTGFFPELHIPSCPGPSSRRLPRLGSRCLSPIRKLRNAKSLSPSTRATKPAFCPPPAGLCGLCGGSPRCAPRSRQMSAAARSPRPG